MRVIAADGKSALGSATTMALLGERGHWKIEQGDNLEAALLSGLGKRGGRAMIISISAADDTHPFSKWIDVPRQIPAFKSIAPRRGCLRMTATR